MRSRRSPRNIARSSVMVWALKLLIPSLSIRPMSSQVMGSMSSVGSSPCSSRSEASDARNVYRSGYCLTVELVLHRKYGVRGRELMSETLQTNPGLAGAGPVLPLGISFTIPDLRYLRQREFNSEVFSRIE